MGAGFGMCPPARFSFGMRGMLDSNDRVAVCGAAETRMHGLVGPDPRRDWSDPVFPIWLKQVMR